MTQAPPIRLTGRDLSLADLAAIAGGRGVAPAPEGLAEMARARRVVDAAVSEGRAVYGVTTGLGAKATSALPEDQIAAFARRTVQGRAHAVGADLPAHVCRAALAVRLNTLLIGAAGARPALAETMAAWLAAGIAPAIRSVGSIGAADLMQGGDFGLALLGEGRVHDGAGAIRPAAAALAAAGIAPVDPGPREGLALVSHSSVSAALAALAVAGARTALDRLQRAAALTMEGFRASLTPLDPDILALRPQPGQAEAAAGLRDLLAGSALWAPGAARRLQDPLSIRNLPQVHGALRAALDHAEVAATAEVNGASDNPAVLADRDEALSNGGYLTPHLAIALGGLAQALSHCAAMQTARIAKLLSPRFSGLEAGLAPPDAADGAGGRGVAGAGYGPVTKTAEALSAEIAQTAAPPPVYPGVSADGLEDVTVHTGLIARRLLTVLDHLPRLAAVEMIVAAEAAAQRLGPDGAKGGLAPALRPLMATIRAAAPPLAEDRPLGDEIEALAARI